MRTQHKLELIGMTFGRLTVESRAHKNENGEIYWNCKCLCGTVITTKAKNLRSGDTKSCGCYHKERVSTHRMTGLPTFKSWESMKQRCTNQNSPDYDRYGGRGITVCKQWLNSFDTFLADMGQRPKGTSLDRKDNEQGYSRENCKWSTPTEQNRNTRNTVKVEYEGNFFRIDELSEKYGVNLKLIRDRLYAGWNIEKILTTPNRKQKLN